MLCAMPSESFIKRVGAAAGRWRAVASTVGLAAICEIGARIGLPGVDGKVVQDFMNAGHGGMLWVYNLIAGGGTGRAALLALGVVPYIAARVYLWLGRSLSSSIRQRTGTEEAKTKAVRAMTLGIAVAQSAGYLNAVLNIPNAVTSPGVWFTVRSVAILTGGAVVASLLAEQILKGTYGDDVITTRGEPVVDTVVIEKPEESALGAEPAGLLLLEPGGLADARPLVARETEKIRR